MCGRYRLSRRKQLVEEYFDASGEEEWNPRYNIAPTQPVPIIRQHPKEPRRVMSLVRWGLIPSWARDASGAVPVHVANEDTDLAAELKRGLAFVRRDKEPNATKKQTDQLKKAKRR